jgi:hypothetical protein
MSVEPGHLRHLLTVVQFLDCLFKRGFLCGVCLVLFGFKIRIILYFVRFY